MDSLGIFLSFALIGIVFVFGYTLVQLHLINESSIRKFVHIGVSHWWCILILFIDSLGFALCGPLLFTLINSAIVYFGIDKLMGLADSKHRWGLVYYPLSLTLLTLLGYTNALPIWACGMGVFVMGYGDGFAAVVGQRYKSRSFGLGKSVVGFITMFVISTVVILFISLVYRLADAKSVMGVSKIIFIALIAALTEAFTPHGLDNVTVPLVVAITSSLLLGVV
ncbi:MAG: diacylglycerol/polyprenol kinase family protein [Sphaerochaetaceae bacterium]|jgi:phytol kinase